MLKKILSPILSLFLAFGIFTAKLPSACALSVSASAAVLMCADTGEILFEHNADKQLPMASTTKIMTAVLALEAAAANDADVEFKAEMIAEGSSMYLKVGDTVPLSGLVAGLLSASGNDAANAIAMSVGKSYEGFAEMMNDRARQLGMESTHFVTPSGLDDKEHYSTARDMAVLMAYAMENEQFRNITSQKSVRVDFTLPQNYSNTYNNHNRLLSLYEHCNGGKTGFTKASGRCLVTSAQKDGVSLVAVTLNAPNDWNDHINMYEYGFEQLTCAELDDTKTMLSMPIVGSDENSVTVTARRSVTAVVSRDSVDMIEKHYELPHFVYAPMKAGATVGRVIYTLGGNEIAQAELVITSQIKAQKDEKSTLERLWENILSFFY